MLFDRLTPPEPDQIIALMQAFRDDPRPDRIDLGVGVYRDADGRTPVMRAIRAAEERMLSEQTTKSYTGLAGEPAFLHAMADLVLAGVVPGERMAMAATPGGTGALRQLMELLRAARPGAAVWVSDPGWPNHPALVHAAGLQLRSYRYLDPASGMADLDAMRADLAAAAPGDAVLLHACCHNPCGADPDAAEWAELAAFIAGRGLLPFLDLAYLGFGDGIHADAAALRHFAARFPEVLVAVSGSKTFGVYRDRVGLALAVCADAGAAGRVGSMLATLNRQNFAFPPDHGARAVTTVLTDPLLRADWEDELGQMRTRIADNRAVLARALRERLQDGRFDFLTAHRGMFSLLGLTPAQVAALRRDHGIYMTADSRANLAGLAAPDAPRIAAAVAAVLG